MVVVHLETFDGIDLDLAVGLAADPRPWLERTAWHADAPCRGHSDRAYFDHETLDEVDLTRCRRCAFRTECAVDGVRQCMDGLLAESPDELWGYYGGLGPVDRWVFVQQVRARAATTGVELYERSVQRSDLVVSHFREGRSIDWICSVLGLPRDIVLDHVIVELSDQGWSNRRIAEVLDGPSYKFVERRRRALGCAPNRVGASSATCAA